MAINLLANPSAPTQPINLLADEPAQNQNTKLNKISQYLLDPMLSQDNKIGGQQVDPTSFYTSPQDASSQNKMAAGLGGLAAGALTSEIGVPAALASRVPGVIPALTNMLARGGATMGIGGAENIVDSDKGSSLDKFAQGAYHAIPYANLS